MSDEPESNWSYSTASDIHLAGVGRLRSVRRENGLLSFLYQWGARVVTKSCLRFIAPLTCDPLPLPERGSFVLVCNHSSHLDALLLTSALPGRYVGRVFCLAAADYFFNTRAKSVFSALWMNALPMRRAGGSRETIQSLRQRLLETESVLILFPEGTRSRSGELGTFRPGVGMLVAGTEVPVIACRLYGAHELHPPGQRFPRRGKVELLAGEQRTFESVPNQREGWEAVARQLEKAVAKL